MLLGRNLPKESYSTLFADHLRFSAQSPSALLHIFWSADALLYFSIRCALHCSPLHVNASVQKGDRHHLRSQGKNEHPERRSYSNHTPSGCCLRTNSCMSSEGEDKRASLLSFLLQALLKTDSLF